MKNQRRNSRIAYLEGTAARQLEYGLSEPAKLPVKKKLSDTARKNREKATHMNPLYVFFLFGALAVMTWTLYTYIQIQSDITVRVKHISVMEQEYNRLKLANDEEYNRITSSVDLEEIRAIAIGELGMTYAQEGQMVTIHNQETDYVRQKADLKK